MRTTTGFILLTLASLASADPSLSVGVQDGNYVDLAGLAPTLRWKKATKTGDLDVEGGLDVKIRDFDSLPYAVWGKAGHPLLGSYVSVRGVVDSDRMNEVDLDFQVSNSDTGTDLQLLGNKGKSFGISKVQAKQRFPLFGGRLTLNPRYNCESASGDATVSYDRENTSVRVDASNKLKLTVAQTVFDNYKVIPAVTSRGEVELEVEKNLGNGNSVAAKVKPNDSLHVKWTDGAWIANIDAPFDGWSFDSINVSVKRKLSFDFME